MVVKHCYEILESSLKAYFKECFITKISMNTKYMWKTTRRFNYLIIIIIEYVDT